MASEQEPGKAHGETRTSPQPEGRPSGNAIDQLRRRADEIRTVADDMRGEETKARMLKIAAGYEDMARRLENRLDHGKPGPH